MDPHALSEDESLRAARSGDRAAFEVLHGRLAGPAYALARRLAGSPDLAADVVQDVFIELVNSARGYRFDGRLRAYVLRMVANSVYSAQRAIRLRTSGFPVRELDRGPEETAVAGSTAGAAWRALAQLDHAERVVVILRACHELPFPEIADVLTEPETTVKSRYHRAIERLRRKLAAWEDTT
ncbi:MAG: sigma-70 family RNA polymerase sigma factor [Armatimonadetes bacterium]|nr:sigma-70 family RNA polymerase sigma factor [Armatimonadota bacterium]